MYISTQAMAQLRDIVMEFEVALRSYISEKVLEAFKTEEEFVDYMGKIKTSLDIKDLSVKPLYMNMYYNLAQNFSKQSNAARFYMAMKFANECYQKGTHSKDGEVPYVSELNAMIILLYDPYFLELNSKQEKLTQDLFEDIKLFKNIRNDLDHPGSNRISDEQVKMAIQFILNCMSIIKEEFFWYTDGKRILNEKIVALLECIDKKTSVINNIEDATCYHEKLLMRENELDDLENYLIKSKRKVGCLALYGYGGVGKTALALEFCYKILKEDIEGNKYFDFLIWFSSKDEQLICDHMGRISIQPIKQVNKGLEQLILLINQILCKQSSEDIEDALSNLEKFNNGLIVIDNFENLTEEERNKIEDFIQSVDPKVQFLITSRQVESFSNRNIEIKGFRENKIGTDFIKEYCEVNTYDYNLFEQEKVEKFIEESCGNTLVMTLMLDRIFEGITTIDECIDNLKNTETKELETIAEFMYKNMFDKTLDETESTFPSIRQVLNILLLYRESIDFHSLRELVKCPYKELEQILEIFVNKCIINKLNSKYQLNEMAIKFVSIKILPGRNEVLKLISEIDEHKKKINTSLENLQKDIESNIKLKDIINDWKAKTESQKIAVAQAYSIYKEINLQLKGVKKNEQDIIVILKKVEEEFDSLSDRSNHPYIKFEKACTLRLFIGKEIVKYLPKEVSGQLVDEIDSLYEEVYISIRSKYADIYATESYAAFVMLYGIFNRNTLNDSDSALKYFEEASESKKLRKEKNIFFVHTNLAQIYCEKYIQTNDKIYLSGAKRSIQEASRIIECVDDTKIRKRREKEIGLIHYFCQVKGGEKYNKKQVKQFLEGIKCAGYMKKIYTDLKNDVY